jgi:hypothetical protein
VEEGSPLRALIPFPPFDFPADLEDATSDDTRRVSGRARRRTLMGRKTSRFGMLEFPEGKTYDLFFFHFSLFSTLRRNHG